MKSRPAKVAQGEPIKTKVTFHKGVIPLGSSVETAHLPTQLAIEARTKVKKNAFKPREPKRSSKALGMGAAFQGEKQAAGSDETVSNLIPKAGAKSSKRLAARPQTCKIGRTHQPENHLELWSCKDKVTSDFKGRPPHKLMKMKFALTNFVGFFDISDRDDLKSLLNLRTASKVFNKAVLFGLKTEIQSK
mmetsp:Transcript_9985/g.15102  ORF Transcript_9985/g.15102 Transcript_9985/m.15102 type:complete len:190 (-) Transcript_9985:952-1521(-)